MNRLHKAILCLTLAALLLGSCQNGPLPGQPRPTLVDDDSLTAPAAFNPSERFTPAACWFDLPAELDLEARCGFVAAPQDRDLPFSDSNRVQLAVMVLKVKGSRPAGSPELLLTGGPGAATIDYAKTFGQYLATLGNPHTEVEYPGQDKLRAEFLDAVHARLDTLTRRELILLDQRGTGYSLPSIACRGESPGPCYNRLTAAGIDLGSYTSVESAADTRDVVQALGYTQVNLIGGSYGSRLAFTILRDHPEIVHAAVLDGISPLHWDYYGQMVAAYGPALNHLFERCQGDPACNTAYPNLERVFYETVEQLNQHPLEVEVGRPGEVIHFTSRLDGDYLVQITWDGLMEGSSTIPFLPKLIYEAHAGQTDTLAGLLWFSVKNQAGAGAFSWELNWTMRCIEELIMTSERAILEAAETLHPAIRPGVLVRMQDLGDLCHDWRVPPVSVSERRGFSSPSPVPVLLISGEFDPGTPPAWGEQVLADFPNGYHVVIHGAGHADLNGSACRAALYDAFFTDPRQAPDFGCLTDIPDLQFYTGESQ